MIAIDPNTAAALWRYCTSRQPEEACGALIGVERKGEFIVTGFFPIANRSPQPTASFQFDASEWAELYMRYRVVPGDPTEDKQSTGLIGTFHSHPAGPAAPSAADLESASIIRTELPVHLILALQTRDWFAYRLTKNHSSALGGEWFIGLNIRISPPA
ncbi:Mov34/MPN/PAD-1 family protein [Paenibacillus sp. HJGM_3]|uniref:Mov34/MPN/PAD-1 family protein n=1 Tax=Paenibacillus sp. HJGM_3 TaxID=3379816 RepID=UPI00385C821C